MKVRLELEIQSLTVVGGRLQPDEIFPGTILQTHV